MLNKFSHRKLKIYRKILPSLLVVIILIYLSGCSTTHNYKALSFFFDGVPDPAAETAIQSNDSLNRMDTAAFAQGIMSKTFPQMHLHSPYQDKQCASCHDQGQMGKLLESLPKLCYVCHEDFSNKYKVLHGPVGGGQCTMCHSPHMSVNEHLLTRTKQSICLFCHNSEQVMATEAHQDIKDTNCTECHNPHGGDDKYILR